MAGKSKIIMPVSRICGRINIIGDKSISHRALMISAIAEGVSEITGLSRAEDVVNTQKCLEKLGVSFEKNMTNFKVNGAGPAGFSKPYDVLYVGNSGTTI